MPDIPVSCTTTASSIPADVPCAGNCNAPEPSATRKPRGTKERSKPAKAGDTGILKGTTQVPLHTPPAAQEPMASVPTPATKVKLAPKPQPNSEGSETKTEERFASSAARKCPQTSPVDEPEASGASTVYSGPKPGSIAKPRGIENLGNYCYAIALLQGLLPLREIWEEMAVDTLHRFPLLKALRESFVSLLDGTSTPFNPYAFLAKVGSSLSKSSRKAFIVNRQQDTCEVLSYILQEMIDSNCVSPNKISSCVTTKISCSCNTVSKLDDSLTLFPLPLSKSVQSSIDQFLKIDNISSYSCRFCKQETNALSESGFISLPEVLIFQIRRFEKINGRPRKVGQAVFCNRQITLPILQTSSVNRYKLVSVLNHNGNLSNGHYTTTVIDRSSGGMYLCNDQSVQSCKRIDPSAAYVLFYVRISEQ